MQIQKTNSVNFEAGLRATRNLNAKNFGPEINKFIGKLSNDLAPEKGCDLVEINAGEGRRILGAEDGNIYSLADRKMLESLGTKFEQTRNNLKVAIKKGEEIRSGITHIDLRTPEKFNASIQRVVEMVKELI